MDDRRNDYLYGNPYLRQKGYPAYPSTSLVPSNGQVARQPEFKQLSRAEREEARRIAEQASFSLDGYQVARREFFSHRYDPTLTIKGNSITFNNACISKLEEVVYVQVLVNPMEEKLLIRPCAEGARDAIRWCIAKDNKRKSREITCGLFTAKLYDLMGWETLYRYKLQGTRIDYQGEQFYQFDLTSTEIYIPEVKAPNNPNAKARRRTTVYPADWRDSFGLPVYEHTASTQLNLLDGYQFADDFQDKSMNNAGSGQPEEQPAIEILDKETGEVIRL